MVKLEGLVLAGVGDVSTERSSESAGRRCPRDREKGGERGRLWERMTEEEISRLALSNDSVGVKTLIRMTRDGGGGCEDEKQKETRRGNHKGEAGDEHESGRNGE